MTSLVLYPSAAALETIGTDASRTIVLDMNAHDAFEVAISAGTASIAFTADSNVDFYVLSASDYSEYTDPNSSSFSVQDSAEDTQSFSFSTAQSGMIFVVDNDDVSLSGASPTGPVSYVLSIRFAGGPTNLSIALAIVAGVAVFSAIGVVLVRARRRRAMQPASPAQPAPPTGIPPPPDDFPPLASPVTQPFGTTRRPMAPHEQDLLLRDFKNQRVRMIVGSTVGLVLAIAYNVFPNLMTLGLSIIAFITPAIVAPMVKVRRAILEGQMMEMSGPLAVVGRKQGFYRVQFGTESVWVSASLYGRMAPNQTNSLTVLPGADVAVAVNGVPLAKTERVRLDRGTRTSAGWS